MAFVGYQRYMCNGEYSSENPPNLPRGGVGSYKEKQKIPVAVHRSNNRQNCLLNTIHRDEDNITRGATLLRLEWSNVRSLYRATNKKILA